MPDNGRTYKVGDEKIYTAFNGHEMVAKVIGHYSDGHPKLEQHSARCIQDCSACLAGNVRPDW